VGRRTEEETPGACPEIPSGVFFTSSTSPLFPRAPLQETWRRRETGSGLRFKLVGGDEGAVELEWHAGQHRGLEAHARAIDDEELGRAGALVVHEGEHVPIVLAQRRGGVRVQGHEAEGLPPNRPSPYSNFVRSPVARSTLAKPDTLGDGEVGVPRLAAEQVAVDHAHLQVHLLRRRQDVAARGPARAGVEADLGEHALEALV
jgi:hypothetical protein